MEFIEGGPIGAEVEERRGSMVYRIRNALSDYDKLASSSTKVNSLPYKVSLAFTKEALYFLDLVMEFIKGGPFDDETEERREDMAYRIKIALTDSEAGIMRTPDGSSFSIECAFCEGSGVFPDILSIDGIETEPCPVCRGRGLNMFKSSPENVTKCRFCGGDGRAWDSSGAPTGEVCPVCKGNGIVFIVPLTDSSDEIALWSLIHPRIEKVSRGRYEAHHYSDSVEAAFKEINKIVKHIYKESTGEELDGAPLMYKAFSPKDPIVHLADLSTESGRNVQNGYMQIFAGAMTGIRNPKAHDNVEIDSERAIHLLMLASLLMSKLDDIGLIG